MNDKKMSDRAETVPGEENAARLSAVPASARRHDAQCNTSARTTAFGKKAVVHVYTVRRYAASRIRITPAFYEAVAALIVSLRR